MFTTRKVAYLGGCVRHHVAVLFFAGMLSVLLFQMGALAILHAIGQTPGTPFPYGPTKPFGVPQIWSFIFFGGLWGIVFGLVERYFPKGPVTYYACSFLFGLIGPVLVLWFIVLPLRGQPVAAGFVASRMLTHLIIHGAFGLGVGVLVQMFSRAGRPLTPP